ncbi:MAG TPA: hypothetical protein VHD91_08740 [Gaiellaceae bacterium]|nr:hypothetical protein [Gaiellaceae bacterium]
MLLASPPPVSPAALRASIVAAGMAQKSVHYVSASKTPTGSVTIVADAGVSQGIQQITFSKGKKSGHATVIVVRGTAYLRGDAFTLTDFIGIKAAGARRYANRWIVVPSSSAAYGPIAAAVTLASALDGLGAKSGTLSKTASRIGGKAVVGVRSVTKASSGNLTDTLWALAGKQRLPVEEVVTRNDERVANTYSNWNERVTVAAPKSGVSITKVLSAKSGPSV